MMSMMAWLRGIAVRAKSCLHRWTATDYRASQTCGIFLLLFAGTILLPPVFVPVFVEFIGDEELLRFWSVFSEAVPKGVLALFFPTFICFFLPGIVSAIFGVAVLIRARRFRIDQTCSTYVRRQCGYFLLCFLFLFFCAIIWSLLPIPWRAFGFSNPAASRLSKFLFRALFGLYIMEWFFSFVHVLAIFLLWCVSLFLAFGMLSPSQESGE